jgi:hypothetical protein
LDQFIYSNLITDGAATIYVGGGFITAEGITVNHIARWNGSSWSALGTGANDYVYSLVRDTSGTIYAGGYFSAAGGIPANEVAKWGKKL